MRSAAVRAAEPGRDVVGAYLAQIGRIDLLRPEDEVRLAQAVQAGLAARAELEVGTALDPMRRAELSRATVAGEAARAAFVQANLRLVVTIAKRFRASGVAFEDLVQEGNLGLLHAVEKFDWRKGFRFSTYATWWIRQSLQRAVQSKGRAIRLPEDALAAEVEADPDHARLPRVVASLDQPLTSEATATLGDVVAADDSPFEEELVHSISLGRLEKAIDRLPELEQSVVRLRFGLDGAQPASLEATARALGIGVRRVRRIEASALQFLSEQPEVEGVNSAA